MLLSSDESKHLEARYEAYGADMTYAAATVPASDGGNDDQRPRLLAHWSWTVANKGSVSLFPRMHPSVPSSVSRATKKPVAWRAVGTQ